MSAGQSVKSHGTEGQKAKKIVLLCGEDGAYQLNIDRFQMLSLHVKSNKIRWFGTKETSHRLTSVQSQREESVNGRMVTELYIVQRQKPTRNFSNQMHSFIPWTLDLTCDSEQPDDVSLRRKWFSEESRHKSENDLVHFTQSLFPSHSKPILKVQNVDYALLLPTGWKLCLSGTGLKLSLSWLLTFHFHQEGCLFEIQGYFREV